MLLTTVMMLASYVMFIYAVAAASGEETVFAGALVGIGLGLVPGVFAVAAFVSQNPRTVVSTLQATGLWFALVLVIGFFSLPVALVTGYGMGGVFAFWQKPGASRRTRLVAVALCAVYTGALLVVFPEFGLFGGAPLPFLAIALADLYDERTETEV